MGRSWEESATLVGHLWTLAAKEDATRCQRMLATLSTQPCADMRKPPSGLGWSSSPSSSSPSSSPAAEVRRSAVAAFLLQATRHPLYGARAIGCPLPPGIHVGSTTMSLISTSTRNGMSMSTSSSSSSSSSSKESGKPGRVINEAIQAPVVRVVFPDGSHQVLSRADALRAAVASGLDLVEISHTSTPPVCRLMDYVTTVQQQQQQQQQLARSRDQQRRPHQDKVESGFGKEIRFTSRIADNDLEVKLKKVKQLLRKITTVNLVMRFSKAGQESAEKALQYILVRLREDHEFELEKKTMSKRSISQIIKPTAAKSSV